MDADYRVDGEENGLVQAMSVWKNVSGLEGRSAND